MASFVGLDIGNQSIKAVELEESKGTLILKKFGYHDGTALNITSNSSDDLKQAAGTLKSFYEESGFDTPDVIVSIPESEVFTRVIKVPQMSEKELKGSIAYEAEQYIPIPLAEVNYDFQIIDTDPLDKNKMDVLLVAAKKAVLEKYVAILKDSKLTPRGLEPETLSIGRALGDNADRPSASMIINVGASSTQIIIVYRGYVRFTRSISMGGDTMTRTLAQSLGFDFAQAEEYKRTYGLEADQAEGKVFDVIKPAFDNILNEIRRSKVFYTTHNPNVIINRAIISGGSALMPGLLFYMASNLDVEVELANPWKTIVTSEKLGNKKDQLLQKGPIYVCSVGLALKGFN